MTEHGDRRRFSILLPTHDRADVIGYAIRSALQQTVADFEILLVCDGCSADTAAVVEGFDDERIRFFDLPKAPGHGWANRNIALREARGELIAFLGDDDLLFPDHLERFAELFSHERIEWAYSRPLLMSDDGVLAPIAVDLRRPTEFERFMSQGNSVPPSCVVHRRSALDRYGYWPHELWDGAAASSIDWELWKRMVGPAGGSNLGYLPIPTSVHFRAHWRDPRSWGVTGMQPWFERARDDWWPPSLRLSTAEADTPQSAAWERLTSDGDGWTSDVRSSVVTVVDGFAWEATASLMRSSELETRIDDLEESLSAQTKRAEVLELRVSEERAFGQSLLGSHSWKATEPLRRMGRWVRSLRATQG